MIELRGSILVFVLALVTASVCPASLAAQDPPRILVTNDDGWDAPGLTALAEALAALGEVVVSAPLVNQSGSSQSLGSLSRGIDVRSVEIAGATEAWAVDATPAGATTFGLRELGRDRPFDLVVSGINRGANVGDVSHNSGTVGAAMQAAMIGTPSIAASLDARSNEYRSAARYTAAVAEAALAQGLPPGLVLSINVPAAATTGDADVVVLPMGGAYLAFEDFEKLSDRDGVTTWRPRRRIVRSVEEAVGQPRFAGRDTEAYLDGKVTVTPLLFDWTAGDELDWVRSWLPDYNARP